jgi:hypothetical protein
LSHFLRQPLPRIIQAGAAAIIRDGRTKASKATATSMGA